MDHYKLLALRNEALRSNSVGMLRRLVSAGGDADDFLRTACEISSPDTCKALVEMGASVGFMSGHSDTALHVAVSCGRVEICRALVEAGADPTFSQMPSSLNNVSDRDERRFNALQRAVREGKSDVVRFFIIECGIDPAHVRTPSGRSLLQIAPRSMVADLRSMKTEFEIGRQVAAPSVKISSSSKSRECNPL